MKIIVDSSVAVSVLLGRENCRECLNAIRQNDSYRIVSCADWANHWNQAISSTKPVTQVHRDFLLEWKRVMSHRRITSASTLLPCVTVIESECEHLDKGRLYLVAIALNTDCYILYCSQFSPTCDRLSAIKHPDVIAIQDKWKKSELPETVQWLIKNA